MNQGQDYFANFTLAQLEYTKSGEPIKNKHNKLIDNNTNNKKYIIIRFRLPSVQTGRALVCFHFVSS